MNLINEEKLEQKCISWFEDTGFNYISGYEIAPDGDNPERSDYQQIILHDRLIKQLANINPQIPSATLDQVANQIGKAETPVLINSNRQFHKYLLEGVEVEYKEEGESKHEFVQLVDFTRVGKQSVFGC